jgi:hypothetical protein
LIASFALFGGSRECGVDGGIETMEVVDDLEFGGLKAGVEAGFCQANDICM